MALTNIKRGATEKAQEPLASQSFTSEVA